MPCSTTTWSTMRCRVTCAYSLYRSTSQPAVLAAHRGQPLVERDPHVVLGEHLEVAGVVDPADVRGQHPLRRDEFDARARRGPAPRRRPGQGAGRCRRRAARRPWPGTSRSARPSRRMTSCDPSVRNSVFGTPPVATMTRSGSSASTSVGLGVGVVPDVDVEVFALGQPPVDDPDQVAPPREEDGEPDLPACSVAGLQHDHAMPALAEHPGRLQAGRPGTDDHRFARRPGRRGNLVGQPVLAARLQGCGCTWRREPGRSRRGSRLAPTHGRIRSSSPAWIFATMCGSAMWARVIPTRSSSPSRMAWRAVATSLIRLACITGTPTARLISPANSRCGATGVPIGGMTPGERLVAGHRIPG